MARFFFSTHNGHQADDHDGTDLPNQGVARVEAIKLVGELLQNFPERFWETGTFELTVANGEGQALFSVAVSAQDADEAQPAS